MKPLIILSLFLSAAAPPGFGAAKEAPVSGLDSQKPALVQEEQAAPISREQLEFFESKIRPVLADKCYKCHAEKSEKIKGGLTLDTREGIRRGGDNGPAVVPGNLKDSLLIDAIRYASKDFSMPPQKSGGKLPEAVIQDFEKWVQMGAPDPRNGEAKIVTKKYDTEKAREWWSFKPPVKAPAPAVQDVAWPRCDSDRFLLAALEAKGIKPVADADKLTLVRRVYFDLVGVPPTLPEVEAFEKDKPPDALAHVVDRLLASPQFGQRWGRHWLDVARYAESSGKDANFSYPHAWRYRDYVIAAFNKDKPYNEFIREQVAGDFLPGRDEREKAEHKIATGYLAIGAKSQNEANPRQFALDVADEQIDAISQGVLGLTIACARCHDHKFDPIPQRDYYALAGIFLSTETRYGTAVSQQNRHASKLVELPATSGEPVLPRTLPPQQRVQMEMKLAELTRERDTLFAERIAARRSGTDVGAQKGIRALGLITAVGMLEAQLNSYDPETGRSKILAMGALDRPARSESDQTRGAFNYAGMKPDAKMAFTKAYRAGAAFPYITDSPLYARGEVDKPGEKVPRGFLTLIGNTAPAAIRPGTSGRLELAEWLVSPQNPLTARVITNRVWHWLFGRGIVQSVDNLGSTGQKPANQALLDFLSVRFEEEGWSIKKLVRELVLSHAYQLSSTYDEKDFAADPENALVWRMSKRRLDAECIRDAMLAASGDLQLQPPMGSAIAMAGDGMVNGARGRGITEETVSAETPVRSVYLPVARDLLPESLALFDFAEPSLVSGDRESTNVPSQALYMLNSPFVQHRAERLGQRVLLGYPAAPTAGLGAFLSERINYAYWLAFSRPPDSVERTAALAFFNRFAAGWNRAPGVGVPSQGGDITRAAWTSFCRALFASAEFRYLN